MATAALSPKHRKPERLGAWGIAQPPPIDIESPGFSGSLAALFQGAHDRRIDLMQVPLLPICQAYFEYLLGFETIDLDESAAAMMALAYLLERKAWGLLPTPDPEPDIDDDFTLSLPTAHEYAIAIEALKVWREERERFYFRPLDAAPDPYEVPCALGEVTPSDLARALERLLRKATPMEVGSLSQPRRSLSEQMVVVLGALTKRWARLDDLVPTPFTREDAVYWFLALLELIRLGQAKVQLAEEDVLFARP